MKIQAHIALAIAVASGHLYALDTLALVQSDGATAYVTAAQAKLMATGKFSQIDIIDARSSTPTAAALSQYTDVLAWTNNFPADGTALGDALAQFYFNNGLGGKHVTIATYALTNPGGISGGISTGAGGARSGTRGTAISGLAGASSSSRGAVSPDISIRENRNVRGDSRENVPSSRTKNAAWAGLAEKGRINNAS